MEIRVLKYFLALAREENLSRAAQVLNTTQPNLSRQLSALENEVGHKLFNRGGRKITLTDEGIFLKDRAQEIVELVEKTKRDFATLDDDITGIVFIGITDSQMMHNIGRAVCNMTTAYPRTQFHFISGDYHDLFHNFDEGLLDFCIFTDPADLNKYHYIKLPGNDMFGVLMRKDSSLAALDVIRPGDIADKSVIMSHEMFHKEMLSRWLGYDCRALHIPATYNLINTAVMLVENGLGYAITHDKLVNTRGTNLCFRPLEPPVKADRYLAWRKHQVFSKAMRKFLEYVQEEVAKEAVKE